MRFSGHVPVPIPCLIHHVAGGWLNFTVAAPRIPPTTNEAYLSASSISGVAVIGAGILGSRHARVLHELPEARLVAVADLNEPRAREVASRHGARGFEDYGTMLRELGPDGSGELDAVTVATYHHQGVASFPGYTSSGWSNDGVIEAFEDEGARFRVGVQWHPEVGVDPRLFEALVAACRART